MKTSNPLPAKRAGRPVGSEEVSIYLQHAEVRVHVLFVAAVREKQKSLKSPVYTKFHPRILRTMETADGYSFTPSNKA